MLVGAYSDVGRVRETNEDSYHAGDSLLIVADGMGGHNAGEVASALAVRYLVDTLHDATNLPDGLVDAIQAANTLVYQDAQSPERNGMGTTLTCAVVRDGTVFVGHVGDSRAYLIRGDKIASLTVDHSIVGELMRSGNLSEEEAKVHPHRHFLTRALGTAPTLAVDVQVRHLEPGDHILLCSDGLTGMVEETDILQIIKGSTNPTTTARKLVDIANNNGGSDNITVVLAQVGA